jgi:hypothetical protein
MEPATIAVLVITAASLGFCIWIERHSRSQERIAQSSEGDDRPEVPEESRQNANGRGTPETEFDKQSPSISETPGIQ